MSEDNNEGSSKDKEATILHRNPFSLHGAPMLWKFPESAPPQAAVKPTELRAGKGKQILLFWYKLSGSHKGI